MNDLINRQEAIDRLDDAYTFHEISRKEHDEIVYWLNSSPSVESCEDAVSRRDAIEAIYEALRTQLPSTFTDTMTMAINMANELPTVQPERQTGHWIGIDQEPCEVFECDQCGHVVYTQVGEYIGDYKYCSNCGADMRR